VKDRHSGRSGIGGDQVDLAVAVEIRCRDVERIRAGGERLLGRERRRGRAGRRRVDQH